MKRSRKTQATMITNLKQLYFDQLRDLHSAETQLLDALPEMVRHSSNAELREAFSEHLEETRHHKSRLEEIATRHGITLSGTECDAMRGLIKEAKKHLAETTDGDVRDAVLIASANRVEHYEIAGYGVARSFANCLDFDSDASVLDQTLNEESAADETITKIATGGLFRSGINEAAVH